jgi:chromate transporter
MTKPLMNQRLWELVLLFGKLGCTSFGGPAVHIAMLEDEVVKRRAWITREHFLDLLGATNLIPGPNSTEMALHVGYVRAGLLGLITAGFCFILPSVLITLGFAWVYQEFQTVPALASLLYGIKPAILVVIFFAVWKLGKTALKSWQLGILGVGVITALLLGMNEVFALVLGSAIGTLWLWKPKTLKRLKRLEIWVLGALLPMAVAQATGTLAPTAISLTKLGWFFLKTGTVLFGSGYVLVAFLETGLVSDYGWLTRQQLLDAVAVGQFTPGPVLSTATFVGYVIAGLPGALISTIGIFLPSFVFVALLNPLIPRLRQAAWTTAFLDAVNLCAVALLGVVVVKLLPSSLPNWPAWCIAVGAGIVYWRWKISSVWLVLGGAFGGWLLGSLGYA